VDLIHAVSTAVGITIIAITGEQVLGLARVLRAEPFYA
jgi:hypothetical protein